MQADKQALGWRGRVGFKYGVGAWAAAEWAVSSAALTSYAYLSITATPEQEPAPPSRRCLRVAQPQRIQHRARTWCRACSEEVTKAPGL